MIISGIIATNLGKPATFSKVAGRERRVHHSKSLPLLLTGERFFFGRDKASSTGFENALESLAAKPISHSCCIVRIPVAPPWGRVESTAPGRLGWAGKRQAQN